jgi:hypothetical protein
MRLESLKTNRTLPMTPQPAPHEAEQREVAGGLTQAEIRRIVVELIG